MIRGSDSSGGMTEQTAASPVGTGDEPFPHPHSNTRLYGDNKDPTSGSAAGINA